MGRKRKLNLTLRHIETRVVKGGRDGGGGEEGKGGGGGGGGGREEEGGEKEEEEGGGKEGGGGAGPACATEYVSLEHLAAALPNTNKQIHEQANTQKNERKSTI